MRVAVLPAWMLQLIHERGLLGTNCDLRARSQVLPCHAARAPAADSGCLRRCASHFAALLHQRSLQMPTCLHKTRAARPRLLQKLGSVSCGCFRTRWMTAAMRVWRESSSSAVCFWGGHLLRRNSAVGKTVAASIFNLCSRDKPLDLAWPALLQKARCIDLRVAFQHGRTDALV